MYTGFDDEVAIISLLRIRDLKYVSFELLCKYLRGCGR